MSAKIKLPVTKDLCYATKCIAGETIKYVEPSCLQHGTEKIVHGKEESRKMGLRKYLRTLRKNNFLIV